MKIDDTTPKLVCIQLQMSEREIFEEGLRELIHEVRPSFMTVGVNGNVTVRSEDNTFLIDCSDIHDIIIILDKKECRYLADALREHIDEKGEWPLDHSFESLGATIRPASLKDVVLETVG